MLRAEKIWRQGQRGAADFVKVQREDSEAGPKMKSGEQTMILKWILINDAYLCIIGSQLDDHAECSVREYRRNVILLEKRSNLWDYGLISLVDQADTLLKGMESRNGRQGGSGCCIMSAAPNHLREPSGIGCGYQRTMAMLLNAAITGLTIKYPEGSEYDPRGYE
ncbi:hypothetical protein DL93DRAFT_2097074 [Clavulina sp. PMI_390]|nr:hypothetical protein DL93DRAFT_2097074 [Clavulina sp. PMI_390]